MRLDNILPELKTWGKTYLAAILLMIIWGAVLLLPHPSRDVVLVAAIVGALRLAWFRAQEVWLAWLVVLPVAYLSGDLFQVHGLIVSRLFTVGLTAILLVRYRDAEILRALARANGFRWFGLFILANIVSALVIGEAGTLFSALTYAEPLLCFIISYYVVYRNPDSARPLVGAILVSGGVGAVIGFYEIATQQSVAAFLNTEYSVTRDTYMYKDYSDRFGLGGRILTLIGQPVVASLYFVFLSILGLWFFYRTRIARIMGILFAVICVVLLLATGTRGGIVALAAAMVVLFGLGLRRWRERIAALGVGVLLLGIMLVTLPNVGTYLVRSVDVQSGNAESRNVYGRVVLAQAMLQMFQEHWLLGYGPGRFQKQASAGIIPTVPGIRSLGGIENQYAAILVDGGIVAGLTYVLFMVGVAVDVVRMLRKPTTRAMGVTLFALFAAYFVFAATETTLTQVPILLLMAVYGAFTAKFQVAKE